MNINKLELIDNGLNGMIISGIRPEQKNEGTIMVDYNDTYKVPVTREMIKKFQDLKVYMTAALNIGLIGFVQDMYDKTRDVVQTPSDVSMVNFLDSLTITKISKKDDIIRIAGKISNLDNGTIGLSTAAITPNTDYGFYDQLVDAFRELCTMANEFRESKKLIRMNSRQYMLDFYSKDEAAQAEVEGMSEADLDNAMIQKLEAKGHLVLSPENVYTPETAGTAEQAENINTETVAANAVVVEEVQANTPVMTVVNNDEDEF